MKSCSSLLSSFVAVWAKKFKRVIERYFMVGCDVVCVVGAKASGGFNFFQFIFNPKGYCLNCFFHHLDLDHTPTKLRLFPLLFSWKISL